MSYVGLSMNITEECEDVCLNGKQEPIWKQKDCDRNKFESVYYAYDDRV